MSLSAVQIYDLHIFLTVYSSLHGFIYRHYCNHVSICWFKLKLERFPKNPVLFLNKAVVPKAIYCFVSVFFLSKYCVHNEG